MDPDDFQILSEIDPRQVIAEGPGVRIAPHLREAHGGRRWRKMKGIATVKLADGSQAKVELHWFESHGVGKFDFKIKRRVN